MLWTRWIIFGLPALLALLTAWSVWEAVASRDSVTQEIVVASDEGVAPGLNPFLPRNKVDHAVAELVHEPLLKIGDDGHLQGALAERWQWSHLVSYWFANAGYAAKAVEKLKALSPEQWERWQLKSVEAVDTELRLELNGVNTTTGAAVWQQVTEFGPLPIETIRVELQSGSAKQHHEFFMQEAVERAQVKSVRFDSPASYELRVSGEAVKFFEEINRYYQNHPALGAKLRVVKRVPMLDRPVLELVLREGAIFHDGTPVTAADVEATARLVLSQGWPVDGAEALGLTDSWDSRAARHVRVAFHEIYGPAIMAFVGLPILPKRWVDAFSERVAAGESPFVDQPPVGAGLFRLDGDSRRSLFLSRKDGGPRVQFVLDQSPAAIRAGFAMQRVDIFWPGPRSLTLLDAEPGVTLRRSKAQNRLVVLWNCRQGPLADARVREALGSALNRNGLIKELLHGEGKVVEGLFDPALWFAAPRPAQPFDLTRARQLLYEAGWARDADGMLSKDGRPLRFELLTVVGNLDRINVASRLQQEWRASGVEVVIKAVPWEEMVDQLLPGRQFDAALLGLNFERTWDQIEFWHSSRSRRGLNFAGVADSGLDNLLTALRNELDPAKVRQLAQEMEDRLLGLHPFLPLFAGGDVVALRGKMTQEGLVLARDDGGFSLREALEAMKK